MTYHALTEPMLMAPGNPPSNYLTAPQAQVRKQPEYLPVQRQ